jgi:DNA polymerase III subunit delta
MPKIENPKSKIQNLVAVVGSDEAEVKRAALELAAELTPPGAGDFGNDIIDGVAEYADAASARIHQTIEALLTLPFFGGEKLVWLKSANFLGDNVLGKSKAVLEALEKLQATLEAGLPDNVRFLLSATEIDKRRAFYKALQKLAKIQVFDRLDSSRGGWEEDAAASVAQRAAARGLRFRGEALDVFTMFTGGETRVIENELEKLDLYLGSKRREVTAADVRLLVPVSRAGVIFELGNALAQRDVRGCLALLDQLLHQGENAVGILLVAIIPTVRNLLLVKDLMQRHKLARPQQPFYFGKTLERLPESALAHLPRKKDGTLNAYPLGIAATHAHRFTTDELRKLMDACLEANVRLVTSQLDERVVLSELLARVAAR